MEKAEIFSFPTGIGSGGRGQSLHNEILNGAKPFKLSLPYFSPDIWQKICEFCPQIVVPYFCRLYANMTSHHKKHPPEPWPTQWKP